VANGVFAMAEIALVAARTIRLQQWSEAGDVRAQRALELKSHSTDFLSTVQVGITMIGIFAGAYSGSTLAEPLALRLRSVPGIGPYSETVALVIVVSLLTYFSLVIGELVPKAIALRSPESLLVRVAPPFAFLARIGSPLVRLLSTSTTLILWLLRIRPGDEPNPTEEEIRALLKQATSSGEVELVEQQIVDKVFHLGDRRVSSLMTPRPDIDWVDIQADAATLREQLASQRHARVFVCDGELDRVVGIAHVEELLAQCLGGQSFDLRSIVRTPIFVPETLTVLALLERFRMARTHTAIVVDEYGGVQGLLTVSDIVEGLFGELPDEPVKEQGPVVQRPDGSWLVDGWVSLDDLRAVIPIPPVPEDEQGHFHTLAGLIMTRLGKVPRAGDAVEWGNLRFEAVDMDGRRVDKVLVTQTSAAGKDETPSPASAPR